MKSSSLELDLENAWTWCSPNRKQNHRYCYLGRRVLKILEWDYSSKFLQQIATFFFFYFHEQRPSVCHSLSYLIKFQWMSWEWVSFCIPAWREKQKVKDNWKITFLPPSKKLPWLSLANPIEVLPAMQTLCTGSHFKDAKGINGVMESGQILLQFWKVTFFFLYPHVLPQQGKIRGVRKIKPLQC